MADTVDRILMRYQSQDFNKVIVEQKTLADRYEKTAKAQDKINTSATKLENRLGKLQSFGRNLRQAGGFLGSDTIMAAGNLADGLSDIGDSINMITKSGSPLLKVLGGLGAVVGGVAAGASIYDATIGKLQGQTAGNILDQLGQFASAGFNQDQLFKNVQQRMLPELNQAAFNVRVAQIKAEMASVEYGKQLQGKSQGDVIKDLLTYGVTAIFGQGGSGRAFQAGQELFNRPGREAVISTTQRAQTLFGAGQNLLQAGQALGQRQAGARNMYQSALYAIEQETGKRRAEIARSYAQSLIQLDQQYYLARQQAAQEYGIEAARMESDHQKDMRRAQEDHEGRLKKLFESRDALAIEDEIEAYGKERSRAEEDYNDSARMRQEDYARQMAEMERAHQEQRNERQRAYQEQIRELNQQAKERRQQEFVQYQLLLKGIIDAFVEARRQFAEQTSTSNSVTNNNKTANVTNHINANMDTQRIKSAVNDAIVEAFR